MRIDELLKLPMIRESVKTAGSQQWKALCPAHEDHNPSLSIGVKDSRIVLHCHAGCPIEAVYKALGITAKDLSLKTARSGTPKSSGRIVACYSYTDEKEKLLYQAVRFEPKQFKCRRPGDKDGEWLWNLPKNTRRVLYRLPELSQADREQWIFIVEGEKDADNLAKIGLAATTNINGAGKWRPEYNESLRDRRVVILPDSDKPGEDHARKVAKELFGIASEVRIVELPDLKNEGEDVSDWLQRGGTKDKLLALVDSAKAYEACDSEAAPEKPRSQVGPLMELCAELELFHDDHRKAWARVPIGDHHEILSIISPQFRTWLCSRYYLRNGKVPRSQALGDAITTLVGEAQFNAPEQRVAVRLCEYKNKLYLDLGDPAWQAVEIDADGWRVQQESPVRFRRPKALAALPEPIHGGSIEALKAFVNIKDAADWILLVAWLLGAFKPDGPYPILSITGEQGSAKSTTCRRIQELIDPSIGTLRSPPRSDHDLMLAASNSRLLAFDNVSTISDWLSDALCRLATGGCFSTRELYSNDEETFLVAHRPMLFNGIVDAASRSDLLDRMICLTLAPIADEDRRIERELLAEFRKVKAQIFGALLDGVSHALRTSAGVAPPSLPRMADFACWAVAGLPGVGISPDEFLDAYAGNRHDVNQLALEDSVLAQAIQVLMEDRRGWCGTCTDLLSELSQLSGTERLRNQPDWPKTPQSVGHGLARSATNLRRAGIDVQEARTGKKRDRRKAITRVAEKPSALSASSAVPFLSENQGFERTTADDEEVRADDVPI